MRRRLHVLVAGLLCAFALTAVPDSAHAFSAPDLYIDFGKVAVGTTKVKIINIRVDPGYTPATFTFPPHSWFSVDPYTSATSGPGERCRIKVTFAPTAVGNVNNPLVMGECPAVPGFCVTGSSFFLGVGGALSVRPQPVDFGAVPPGESRTKNVTLKPDPGYFIQNFFFGAGTEPPFSVDPGTCATVTPGASCRVSITFAPTALGLGPGDKSVSFNECPLVGSDPCASEFIGVHAIAGAFSARPDFISFGAVPPGRAHTQNITVKLDPGYKLTTVTGNALEPPFTFDDNGCLGAAVSNCRVKLKFAPTGLGQFARELTLTECAAGGSPCVDLGIPVRGDGGV